MYLIEHASQSPEQFVESILSAVTDRQLGRLMSFSLEGPVLNVIFKRAGTSTFVFDILPSPPLTTRLRLARFELCPMHKDFRAEVEITIVKLLKNFGATVVG